MNNVLTEAEGLNAAIQTIQVEVYEKLATFWSGDIEGFGRAYKNIANTGKQKETYYRSSKIFTPEVYNSVTKNYGDVFYNIDKACVFCFLISDTDDTDDELVFTSKIKLVFMTNLNMIYPSSSERVDGKAQKDAMDVLRNINGDYTITGIERGSENIFTGYTAFGTSFDDMHPLHMFSINFNLNYYLTDKCT
jgi:hypothetical protein